MAVGRFEFELWSTVAAHFVPRPTAGARRDERKQAFQVAFTSRTYERRLLPLRSGEAQREVRYTGAARRRRGRPPASSVIGSGH